jgi:undecaprenyl-diphosphatase
MTFLDALLLGLVEGITEFLPISSTGHLMLTAYLLHGQAFLETPFVKTFDIVIQVGAILAAAALYWRRLLLDWRTLTVTCVAFVPTGALGFVLYRSIKSFLGNPAIVVCALLAGGVVLLLLERWLRGRKPLVADVRAISYPQAFVIGCVQALSMIPGVSRSAATIMAGLTLGVSRHAIVEFSFLLAIPTMLAASAYDMYKSRALLTMTQVPVLAAGFVVAFIVALLVIKLFLRFVQTHTFNAFGLYRIVAAILFWLVVLR